MVSEPEDMVVMRFYCHLLGLGYSLFPFPRSQVPGPRSKVPGPTGPRSQSQSQSLDNLHLISIKCSRRLIKLTFIELPAPILYKPLPYLNPTKSI